MNQPDTVIAETFAERARLAALLGALPPDAWAAPSLCAGWQVRHVVAHMTMPYRTGRIGFVAGLVRARFSFDRFADRAARTDVRRLSDLELLDSMRDNIEHPWRPPGGGPEGALSHDVIHGLDITEPLGLPGPSTECIALVLEGSTEQSLDYFGRPWDGHRLIAADADIALGEGTPVTLPAKEMLLVVTGRRSLADTATT